MGLGTSKILPELQEIHFSPGNDEVFQPVPLPIDTDGFITAFSVDQEEGILKFFEKHGVVVVANVLAKEQCQRSIDGVWRILQEMFNPDIRRDQPETWSYKWSSVSKFGILGNDR
ncbi:unnamed protein product [Rotaria magnacalcarata]|uniref:Uncharacterized protein n=1 Tax=Rotaria magnacalcarata TaxID=392030 RepID=A0A814N2Q8_9BILA|nr:unnamed protein product [Rotaria magnacalcarata]CAF1658835.1 unnamed protein product [Rotaria magnacalcarata]CAF1926793.1 unnamed protein product [Rotaria magnacalcarata]CAF2079637.1 unnamed protein product [Rotaria magnacalcarata]CAF2091218.1 unnamed protein product [Rotaria magnacalcarata]